VLERVLSTFSKKFKKLQAVGLLQLHRTGSVTEMLRAKAAMQISGGAWMQQITPNHDGAIKTTSPGI
jgi:hypothetical protein